jgi:hypothetical protein
MINVKTDSVPDIFVVRRILRKFLVKAGAHVADSP